MGSFLEETKQFPVKPGFWRDGSIFSHFGLAHEYQSVTNCRPAPRQFHEIATGFLRAVP
jgi:hypothetical protein